MGIAIRHMARSSLYLIYIFFCRVYLFKTSRNMHIQVEVEIKNGGEENVTKRAGGAYEDRFREREQGFVQVGATKL